MHGYLFEDLTRASYRQPSLRGSWSLVLASANKRNRKSIKRASTVREGCWFTVEGGPNSRGHKYSSPTIFTIPTSSKSVVVVKFFAYNTTNLECLAIFFWFANRFGQFVEVHSTSKSCSPSRRPLTLFSNLLILRLLKTETKISENKCCYNFPKPHSSINHRNEVDSGGKTRR